MPEFSLRISAVPDWECSLHTHTHAHLTERNTLPETELPSMLGVSASHRQVQWTKVEHIPETLHAARELINLPRLPLAEKKTHTHTHREAVIILS